MRGGSPSTCAAKRPRGPNLMRRGSTIIAWELKPSHHQQWRSDRSVYAADRKSHSVRILRVLRVITATACVRDDRNKGYTSVASAALDYSDQKKASVRTRSMSRPSRARSLVRPSHPG